MVTASSRVHVCADVFRGPYRRMDVREDDYDEMDRLNEWVKCVCVCVGVCGPYVQSLAVTRILLC